MMKGYMSSVFLHYRSKLKLVFIDGVPQIAPEADLTPCIYPVRDPVSPSGLSLECGSLENGVVRPFKNAHWEKVLHCSVDLSLIVLIVVPCKLYMEHITMFTLNVLIRMGVRLDLVKDWWLP